MKRKRASTWWAIRHQRCPKCKTGPVFNGRFAMNSKCPNCGLMFEREPGYFLGALYISYAVSVLIIALLTALILAVFPVLELHWAILIAAVAFLPVIPPTYRYARLIWINFDRSIDPP